MGMIYIDTDVPGTCCPCRIVDKDTGRDILVQTDWDYPGFATSFGFDLASVKPEEPDDYVENWRELPEFNAMTGPELAPFRRYEKQCNCGHDCTDGTVKCEHCGMEASMFIAAAYDFLRDNDGLEAKDPGYFAPEEA